MDEIEKHIIKTIEKRNQEPIADFEGYSPSEMQVILYDTFNSKSPIQILKAEENDYLKIPILNQVKFLLNLIETQGELKLTNKGFLTTKVVADLYKKQYLKDYFIEKGISKLYKESDVPTITLARILIELSILVKKRNNKLSLTKKGAEIINNDYLLFQNIFETFATKFNWGYFDNFSNQEIGQIGFGFSLILIEKYGVSFKQVDFYSKKYLKAFEFDTKSEFDFIDNPNRSYPIRTFERFLEYFGLIEFDIDNDNKMRKVKKTRLFDKLIKIRPHNTS